MKSDNKFFERARRRAAEILKNKEKLGDLLKNSMIKVEDLKNKSTTNKALQQVQVIIRMIQAYKNGEYRNIQWKSILLLVAAITYLVMPIDLIPDFIPFTGFVDDFAVIFWVHSQLQQEVDNFLAWEEQKSGF